MNWQQNKWSENRWASDFMKGLFDMAQTARESITNNAKNGIILTGDIKDVNAFVDLIKFAFDDILRANSNYRVKFDNGTGKISFGSNDTHPNYLRLKETVNKNQPIELKITRTKSQYGLFLDRFSTGEVYISDFENIDYHPDFDEFGKRLFILLGLVHLISERFYFDNYYKTILEKGDIYRSRPEKEILKELRTYYNPAHNSAVVIEMACIENLNTLRSREIVRSLKPERPSRVITKDFI